MISSVLTVAPLRISFIGGGTDFPDFYLKSNGAVVSCAIKKYVYVHVKRHDEAFQEKFRISYSEVEHTDSISKIKNSIVRACLEFMDFDEPLQISTSSDLPAGSGLGSSSSLTAAILLSLHALRGEKPSHLQLAEETCAVEIDLLSKPIGKQDQYISVFGGMNFIEFKNDGNIKVIPINQKQELLEAFLSKCMLTWTKISREADSVLTDQKMRIPDNYPLLKELTSLTYKFREILQNLNIDFDEIATLINNGWKIKNSLSPKILSQDLANQISALQNSHEVRALKLLGAGAGGFLLTLHSTPEQTLNLVSKKTSSFIPELDYLGCRVVSTF